MAPTHRTRDYAERVTENGGGDLNVTCWHEPEEATTAVWTKKSYYPKAVLRHRVSEPVPLIMLAASGLGVAYPACNLGDRHLDLFRAPFQKPIHTEVPGYCCIEI